MKLAGLLPGVPDLCIIAKDYMQFIELKKHSGGLSAQQIDFITKAGEFGWKVDVFYADTPQEALPLFFPLMLSLGYDHNLISQSSKSALSSLE